MLKKTGFSLTELMVVLLILGEISAFAIPKVISASQDSKRKAVFKETLAAFYDVINTGLLTGVLTKESNGGQYMLSKLNTVKTCTSDATAQQCWTHASTISASEFTEAGAILHNGATIAGIFPSPSAWGGDNIVIDWNGAAAPNIAGTDQLYIRVCYDNTGANFYTWGCVKEGEITPIMGPDKTLYAEIFN